MIIFPAGSAFPQCHASTVAALSDGGLVVAWFAGAKEGDPDTAIWMAHGDGATWSAPRRVFKADAQAHYNPVLFPAPDGVLHCWFKSGPDCARWRSWHALSRDGGQSWSAPAPFLPDDVLARGPVRCHPVVARDGSWLAGGSDELARDPDGREWWPFIERSADGGATWSAAPIRLAAGAPPGKGGIQPTLWCDGAGCHCLLRTGLGAIYRSDSVDGGRSWCPAYATDLPNNNSGIVIGDLGDGRLALVWNPVAGDWAARTPLRLSLSMDGGRTWPRHRDLASGPGEFSYPAIAIRGHRLAVTWTDRRQSIACWIGTEDDTG